MSSEKSEEFSRELNEFLAFRDDEERIEFQAELLHLEFMDQVQEMMNVRGWKKADLAKHLGTSKSYVTQLFTGDKLLNLKMIVKLWKLFDCKLSFSFVSEKLDQQKWVVNVPATRSPQREWPNKSENYSVSQNEDGNYELSYRSA